MQEKKKKEKWGKPKLIILTRGNPEERVLAACKSDTQDGSPASSNNSCAALDCGSYKCASYDTSGTCNSDCSAWGVS